MGELFRNTLGPAAWTAIALVPPAIFALYFLKLKRQPLEVPSTYLWTKVIEDLHVNSLWQRLRRNLLLLLQLLLVFLAILALLRPGWQGQSLEGERFIFLVDNSASMSTADADGEARLDAAKKRVEALIDQLESDMSAMIISFADQPDIVQEFTDNRRLLREALERIEPTARPTRIRGALELADGFANPGRVTVEEGGAEFDATAQEPVELFIFSDGRFGAVEGFSLGNLRPQYLPIGDAATSNLAISALTTRRNENRPELRQAFVQAANYSDQARKAVIELHLDDQLIEAAEVEMEAGETAGVTFELGDAPRGVLRARLSLSADAGNRLSLDDQAYAVLDELRDKRTLLVTPGNTWLELGLSTERARRLSVVEKIEPAALERPEFQRQLQTEGYDLVIFDRCVPKQMPLANTLFIGRLPPLEQWIDSETEPEGAATVVAPQIIDWQRGHPLLGLVEFGNVGVVESFVVDPPSGGARLIDSNKGTLMAIAPRDSYEDAVLGFEIVGRDEDGATNINTDWPRYRSFPNFCLNVLEYLAGGVVDYEGQSNKPGEPVEMSVRNREARIDVSLPDGATRTFPPATDGKFVFHEAEQLGVYEVDVANQPSSKFAVNLFDREESDIRLRLQLDEETGVQTVQSVSIGYVDVDAQSPTTPMRKELWKWLLLAALAVLVLEWYIYNRRVYV